MWKFIISVIFFKNHNDRNMINYYTLPYNWIYTSIQTQKYYFSLTRNKNLCMWTIFFHPHHYLVSRNVGNGFMVNLTWNERGRNFYFRMMLNVQCSTLTFFYVKWTLFIGPSWQRGREAKTASFAQNGKLDNPSQEMR